MTQTLPKSKGVEGGDGEIGEHGGLCAKAIREFVSHPLFETFILCSILANAVVMAIIGPEPDEGSAGKQLTQIMSYVFTPLYTLEAMLKIAGYGLMRDHRSYLRDPWCQFDCVVVIASWVDLFLGIQQSGSGGGEQSNLLVIRLIRFVRVFRVIRGASKIQASKIMVEVVVSGMYNSRYVLLLIIMFIIFNCTLGLSWFGHELRYKCAVVDNIQDPEGVSYPLTPEQLQRLYDGEAWKSVTSAPQLFNVPDSFCRHKSRPLSSWGRQCRRDEGMMCVLVDEPAFEGLRNFENLGSTMFTVTAVLLQQDWDEVMIATMQATAEPCCLFFMFITVFGSLFLMEYTVAILCTTYIEIKKANDSRSGGRDNTDLVRNFDQALVQVHMGEVEGAKEEEEKATKRSPITEPAITLNRKDSAASLESVDVTDWGSLRSYPFVDGSLNTAAASRIRQMAAHRYRLAANPKYMAQLHFYFDYLAYLTAGLVMYPMQPSEMYAAGGPESFGGADPTGRVSNWELGVTVLSIIQVGSSLTFSQSVAEDRKMGLEVDTAPSTEWVFFFIFLLDMLIKLLAFKGRGYMKSFLNQADSLALLISLIAHLTFVRPDMVGLRVFRWIRILALAKNISGFGPLLRKAFGSVAYAVNAVGLMTFFVVILAIVGQQLFAGADPLGDERNYYGSFYLSLVSMVELSTKNGLVPMIQQGLPVGVHTAVFLVVACFLMEMIILRLMIPLIASKFEEAETLKIQYQIFFEKVVGQEKTIWDFADYHQEAYDVFSSVINQEGAVNGARIAGLIYKAEKLWNHKVREEEMKVQAIEEEENKLGLNRSAAQITSLSLGAQVQLRIVQSRKWAFELVVKKEFDIVMSFIIILAAVLAGLCSSWQCLIPESMVMPLDVIFTIIFTLEFIVKAWGLGLITNEQSYFRRPANILDFVVVLAMWSGVLKLVSVSGVETIRLLRLIRVIVMLRLVPFIGDAFNSLAAVRIDSLYIMILVSLIMVIFISTAMPLYGGLLSGCSDPGIGHYYHCAGYFWDETTYDQGEGAGTLFLLRPRVWGQAEGHFDKFFDSLFTTFFLFLNYSWTTTIFRVMSITGPGSQPMSGASVEMGMPFIVFQLINILVWQLVVSIVINSVRHADGSAFQTDDQKEWNATRRMIAAKCQQFRKEKPSGWEWAHNVTNSTGFQLFVNCVILVNIGSMLSESYGMSSTQAQINQMINLLCLVIYYCEMVLLLLAGPFDYFLEAWKVFDFCINIISTVDAISALSSGDGSASSVGVQSLRAMRVMRILRMAHRHQAISLLMSSSIQSFHKCTGCFALWAATTVVFALCGNQFFAGVKQGVLVDPLKSAHFNNVGTAILWLFRIAVGSDIFQVIEDLEVQHPFCTLASEETNNLTDCGPGVMATRLFFSVFCFCSRFVLFPLISGTIVTTFFNTVDEARAMVKEDDVNKFEKAWKRFDRKQTGYITSWKLRPLLESLRSLDFAFWFDKELHPGKMALLEELLASDMTRIRNEILRTMDSSFVQQYHMRHDVGQYPGQLRYDAVFAHLVALKLFPNALQVPAMSALIKLERICSATFEFSQQRIIGDLRRRILLSKQMGSDGGSTSRSKESVNRQSSLLKIGSVAQGFKNSLKMKFSGFVGDTNTASTPQAIVTNNKKDPGSKSEPQTPLGTQRSQARAHAPQSSRSTKTEEENEQMQSSQRSVSPEDRNQNPKRVDPIPTVEPLAMNSDRRSTRSKNPEAPQASARSVSIAGLDTERKDKRSPSEVESLVSPRYGSRGHPALKSPRTLTPRALSRELAFAPNESEEMSIEAGGQSWAGADAAPDHADRGKAANVMLPQLSARSLFSDPGEDDVMVVLHLDILEEDWEELEENVRETNKLICQLRLDFALSLDIKLEQVEIASLDKQPRGLMVVCWLMLDPESQDDRRPKHLLSKLRGQVGDPNSDLRVLMPLLYKIDTPDEEWRIDPEHQRTPPSPRRAKTESKVLQRHSKELETYVPKSPEEVSPEKVPAVEAEEVNQDPISMILNFGPQVVNQILPRARWATSIPDPAPLALEALTVDPQALAMHPLARNRSNM